jgi:hypothetical protein
MHSLNSVAGIRKYRVQDEMPNGFSFAIDGTRLNSVDAGLEDQQELTEKPEAVMSRAFTSLGRIASRIFSRLC